MRIPVYDRDIRHTIPGGNAGFPRATADTFGEDIGKATAKLGQTIASTFKEISSDIQQYQDKADTSNANFALSNAETTASVETMKAEHETSPDQIGGYADRRRERDNEIGQEMLAKVPPSQQQRAQLHWQNYSKRSYLRSYEHEQKHSEAHWSSRVDEQAGKAAAALESAPEDLASARIRLEETIAGLPMPDWKKRQMLGAAMPALVHGAMQGYAKKLDGDPTRPESRPIGRQRDDIILQMQQLRKSMDAWGTDHDTRSRSDAETVVKHANALGISPRDYAAVISYETGGTMDPNQWGGVKRDGSDRGKFLGPIQMSPESQRKYGVTPGMTFDQQLVAAGKYLKDRGLQPGHGVAELYSIINAGSLDKAGKPRWDEPDANGTVRENIGKVTALHYPRADKFLGEVKDTLGPVQTSMPALTPIRTATGKEVTVAGEHAEQFKGFLEDYERTGGDISAIGGYNVRNIAGTNKPSLHSFGRAIDINQGGRNVPISGKQFHPLGVKHEEQLAAKWGLIAGSTWANPDRGHFEVRNAPGAVAARKHPFLGAAQDEAGSGGTDGRVQYAQAGGAPLTGGAPVPGMTAKKRAEFGQQMDRIIEGAVNKSKLGDREEAAALTSAINDDQAQIIATGKQSPLNRERVERSQGPAYAESWQARRDASTNYYNRMLGLAELSPLEAEQRVASLRPLEGPEFPFRQTLHDKARDKLTALDKMRTTDPAAFADNTRAIKEFRQTMKPGNVADTESLIAARMDTQRMLGVPEPLIAPITNEEAKGLGLRVIDKLGVIEPKQRAVALRELAQGLEQTYGAKYAYPVLTYAVQHMGSTDKETASEIAAIVREVQIGEHEPGKLVTERKRAAAEAETALKSLQGDFSLPWTTRLGTASEPPRIDLTGADGNPMSVKFRDLQWLVTSPANAQPGFDATYGEGAAWAVINNLRTYGSTADPVAMGEGPAAVKGPSVSRPGGRASFEGQNVPTMPAPIAPATPATPSAGQRNYAPDDVKRLAADPENQRTQFEQQYGPGSADEALQIFNSRPGRQKKSEGGDLLEGLALQMAMFSEGNEDKINQLIQHTTASREFLRDENTGALTGMRVAGKEYGVKRDKNNRLTGMTVKET